MPSTTSRKSLDRAHQASGREILITSTAALAAERLANELTHDGVCCTAYSTAGLYAAITGGRVQLTPDTTQLGDEHIPVTGRPYELNAGDHVQVRRTIHHEQGQLRNGTSGTIAGIDPGSRAADLRVADGTELRLEERDIAQADLRLAYVQHPLPAQGRTTDTVT